VIDCNEWKTKKWHECANMGKVKLLELWWQLYRTSFLVWNLENFRPMEFCWHECTYISQGRQYNGQNLSEGTKFYITFHLLRWHVGIDEWLHKQRTEWTAFSFETFISCFSLFLPQQILKILVNCQGFYNIILQHRVNKRDQQIIIYFYIKNYN